MTDHPLLKPLENIARALNLSTGQDVPVCADLAAGDCFVWEGRRYTLRPAVLHALPPEMLVGLDGHAAKLLDNTLQFARGYSANNALLWGARGMGKSSLVRSVFARARQEQSKPLHLIEISRDELSTLPDLLAYLAQHGPEKRFILYCDDLSFETGDTSFKNLKVVLEGGLSGPPANVLIYATSNRRHLMARDIRENEEAFALHGQESGEEKISLSDRFGLWLGFYGCDQPEYLEMVHNYARAYCIPVSESELECEALQWAQARGSRSGRVAWQFIKDLAGRHRIHITDID